MRAYPPRRCTECRTALLITLMLAIAAFAGAMLGIIT